MDGTAARTSAAATPADGSTLVPGAAAAVRVPATSANLGPGFDAFGLALSLADEVVVQVVPEGLHVSVTGECADTVPRDETHLVVRALRAGLAALGAQASGLVMRCTNRIPHGRGLGSSAAAAVAGLLLARGLVADRTGRLDDDALLRLAAAFDGHADNVAACLLGGLTVAWHSAEGPRATHLDVSPDVRVVALVPDEVVSTVSARRMLPDVVPHGDAAANAGRAGLLVHALARQPELLLDATEDLLHQGYRESAMPTSLALLEGLRADGFAAVLSGAGPTVLVLGTASGAGPRRVDVEELGRRAPAGWATLALTVDRRGAHLVAD